MFTNSVALLKHNMSIRKEQLFEACWALHGRHGCQYVVHTATVLGVCAGLLVQQITSPKDDIDTPTRADSTQLSRINDDNMHEVLISGQELHRPLPHPEKADHVLQNGNARLHQLYAVNDPKERLRPCIL